MTSNEVLAMYETLASLTGNMSAAAQANDWDGLSRMEDECATVKSAAATGIPALDGAARQRKIALIKQIMANDRAIRACTEPWMPVAAALFTTSHWVSIRLKPSQSLASAAADMLPVRPARVSYMARTSLDVMALTE